MRGVAWIFIFIYLAVTVLWIMNSSILFSGLGITVWLILTLAGFVVSKKLKETPLSQKGILYSSCFMVFLFITTGVIEWAVSSMP
ncbi:hypothetical protein [Bacillus kexueae]|uniref:hypothetical protein n=1 Tax=Aeribacillus kexueae TaxID=2078952 RepID=UPI001FAF5FA5|nr:hypothetical protein [Bacillus kexueae]